MESDDIVIALAAIAQSTRLAIFRLLVQTGEEGMSAGRIAEVLNILPSSLSFHLKELHHSGLIKSKQEGRFVIYFASYDGMRAVLDYLTENCCNGKIC